MDQQQFINRLKSLSFIEPDQLPELTRAEQAKFAFDPVRYLIRASDNHADAIWREVEKRQMRTAPTHSVAIGDLAKLTELQRGE